MKIIMLFIYLLFVAFCWGSEEDSKKATISSLTLSSNVFKSAELKFEAHHGPGAFDNYLSMKIPYEPVYRLSSFLGLIYPLKLKTRNEAHITVITPVEYDEILKAHIKIEEIDAIAQQLNIQYSLFEVLCLGRGRAQVNNKTEETFYIVIKSGDLLKIRVAIYNLLKKRGGDPKWFSPQNYYPHITVAFSLRDLHQSDGVIKDEKSCYKSLSLM